MSVHQNMGKNVKATKKSASRRAASVQRRKKNPFPWILTSLMASGILAAAGIAGYEFYSDSEPLAQVPTVETIQKGKSVYSGNCAECHGAEMQGEDFQKPQGGRKADGSYLAPALDGTGHAWHHADQMLFDLVKNGSIDPLSSMRGFQEKLSEEEMVAVIHYIKWLWPESLRKDRLIKNHH